MEVSDFQIWLRPTTPTLWQLKNWIIWPKVDICIEKGGCVICIFYGNLDNRFSEKGFKTGNSVFITGLNKQLFFFLKVYHINYDIKILKSDTIFMMKFIKLNFHDFTTFYSWECHLIFQLPIFKWVKITKIFTLD